MSGEIMTTGRSADSIATEIRVIVAQTQQVLTYAAVKIGQNLIEAKQLVPHGEWGDYIKHSCGFSQRSANTYMQLAEEFGNSQTFANLPYSKALALLALPEGERESFTEEHDVAQLSVRELKKQIKALTQRAEKAESSDQTARTMLAVATEENGAMQQRLSTIDADYRAQLDTVDKENDALRTEVAQLKTAAGAPSKISAEDAEKLRAEGRAQVEKELREEFLLASAEDQEEIDALEAKSKAQAAQIAELEKQLEEAKAAPTEVIQGMAKENDAKLAQRDARIEELERQLAAARSAASDSDVRFARAEIQRYVNTVGEGFNALLGYLLKAEGRGDDATAKAIRALVAQQIKVVCGKFGVVA